MRNILIAILLAVSQVGLADEPLFKVKELSLEYKAIKDGVRDPMYPFNPPKQRLNLNLNFEFFYFFFWENQIWSVIDQTQFRGIGWNFFLGAHVLSFVDIGFEHFSKHYLDEVPLPLGFPVEDSIYIRIMIYGEDRRRPGLLKWIWD